MSKLISVDFHADFGFLKKPDTNNPMYFSFNMLHKPALLGILGAIIGEKGFYDVDKLSKSEGKGRNATSAYERGEKPDYYRKFEHLKIAIKPLQDDKGVFTKDTLQYNNGTGFASEELGGNLIIKEQLIIAPSYRCFIYLEKMDEEETKLYEYLQKGWAEYLPYLGKNDFSLWWDNFEEYSIELFDVDGDKSFSVDSVFLKDETLREGKERVPRMSIFGKIDNSKFMYFENLPINYDTVLWQYQYEAFAYTNFTLKANYRINDLYEIKSLKSNEQYIIQLF
jgi:CRISPR-associated protein Cas5h